MALKLGELVAILRIDDKAFRDGVDRSKGKLESFGGQAGKTGAAIAKALGPALLVPAVAASAAGIAGLGASIAGAGAALGVFGAVFKSSFGEVQEAAKKTQDLKDKIELLGQQAKLASGAEREMLLKQQAKAAEELRARLALLPPEQRKVVEQYGAMTDTWKAFVEKNSPATYGIMTTGFRTIQTIIPKLQPLYDVASAAVQRLVGWLQRTADGGGIDRLVAFLTAQAGPAIEHISGIARNLGITLGALFKSTAPSGEGMLGGLERLTEKLANWSAGGGFERFMAYVSSEGPSVATTLGNLASTVGQIYQILSPLAPVTLAVASALASIIAAVPPGVITALVVAWLGWNAAMKAHDLVLTLVAAKTTILPALTKAWAAAQWLLNVAMSMNPIGLVILAIVALIAVFVLLWNKCSWFRNFWIATWELIKTAASAAWRWIKSTGITFWNWISALPGRISGAFSRGWSTVKSGAAAAWSWVRGKVQSFYSWVIGLPGKISSKMSGAFSGLWTGFRAAANRLIGGWNRLSFGVPGFSFAGVSVPGININTPDIPYLAKGGIVPATPGGRLVGVAEGGEAEAVIPLSKLSQMFGRMVLELRSSGRAVDDMLIEILRGAIKPKGGNVQVVLGSGRG